jgi:hypothetical protein
MDLRDILEYNRQLELSLKEGRELLEKGKILSDNLFKENIDLNQQLLTLEEKNQQQAEMIELKDKTIDNQQIELDLHANFKSVLRYCDEMGLKKNEKERQALGKALSKISRLNGLEIHKVRADETSGRYETVNSYVPRAFDLYESQNPALF